MNTEGKKIRYQFLSVLSHELKAPLNAIEGYLRMMQEKQAGDLIEDYATPIERSLQRISGMRNLIMDLLDFTKIRLERREERIQSVDLAALATGSIATVRPYAIQMEVSIDMDVRSDAVISADPDDMEIIFNNLISNAVKYNKTGGKVVITIDSTPSDVIVVFSDTGIGINKTDTENLFTEFVRIRNEKTKNISGSGLGLSIVKKVIELYHGSIKVESTVGTGSTFTVQLPKQHIVS
jgi:signal transduction histidine kinase